MIAADRRRQLLLLPARPAAAGHETRGEPAGVERQAVRLVRVEHEFVATRPIVGRPLAAEGPPGSGRRPVGSPAELPRIDANPHVRPLREPARRSIGRLIGASRVFAAVSLPGEESRAGEPLCRCGDSSAGSSTKPLDRAARFRRGRRVRRADPRSPTTSGSAPRFAAITGTPSVMASRTGIPNPSSNDGRTRASAPSYSAWRPQIDIADVTHQPGERRVRDPLAAIDPIARWPCRPARAAATLAPIGEPFVGIEQCADVLARLQSAEKQHVTIWPEEPDGASMPGRPAGKSKCDPAARPAAPDFPSRELRDRRSRGRRDARAPVPVPG